MTESRTHRKSLMSEKGRRLPELFSCIAAPLLHCPILLFLPRLKNQRVWSSPITMVSILLSIFLPVTEHHIMRQLLLHFK